MLRFRPQLHIFTEKLRRNPEKIFPQGICEKNTSPDFLRKSQSRRNYGEIRIKSGIITEKMRRNISTRVSRKSRRVIGRRSSHIRKCQHNPKNFPELLRIPFELLRNFSEFQRMFRRSFSEILAFEKKYIYICYGSNINSWKITVVQCRELANFFFNDASRILRQSRIPSSTRYSVGFNLVCATN